MILAELTLDQILKVVQFANDNNIVIFPADPEGARSGDIPYDNCEQIEKHFIQNARKGVFLPDLAILVTFYSLIEHSENAKGGFTGLDREESRKVIRFIYDKVIAYDIEDKCQMYWDFCPFCGIVIDGDVEMETAEECDKYHHEEDD